MSASHADAVCCMNGFIAITSDRCMSEKPEHTQLNKSGHLQQGSDQDIHQRDHDNHLPRHFGQHENLTSQDSIARAYGLAAFFGRHALTHTHTHTQTHTRARAPDWQLEREMKTTTVHKNQGPTLPFRKIGKSKRYQDVYTHTHTHVYTCTRAPGP